MRTLFCRSDKNEVRFGVFYALIVFTVAIVIQLFLTFGKVELPQKKGKSLLSLISDDTRMVVSESMMKKADAYFHGGVTVTDCTLEKHAAAAVADMGEHDHHHHHEVAKADLSLRMALKMPFLWINSQVHAREHRHLSQEHSVELLPWVAAAVMASPHNIQAYESGSYILNRMTEKPDLAITFLKQGISNNSDNATLELSLSELYFNTLKDSDNACIHLKAALAKSMAKKGRITENDLFERLKIYFYLGVIAKNNHDIDKLKLFSQRASEINQSNVMTRTLIKWLNEMQENKKE